MLFYQNGEWSDFCPYRTHQFVFEHHTPIPGLAYTVIPDGEVRRILGNVVRGIGERGCWGYGTRRTCPPRIKFRDAVGELHLINGNRFALLLRDDAPIPPVKIANHEAGCPNWDIHPLHVYRGTQGENQLDAYLDGRRSVGPDLRWNASDYAQHALDRLARQGQPVRCQRFFSAEIRAELAAATRPPPVASAA